MLPKWGEHIPWSACVRTPEKQIGHQHTLTLMYTHTHTLCTSVHWRTETNFFHWLTSRSCPDSSSIKKKLLSLHKTLVAMRTSTRGPVSKTRRTLLTPPLPCNPILHRRKRTDDSFPRHSLVAKTLSETYYILLDAVLAICRYASMSRSSAPHGVEGVLKAEKCNAKKVVYLLR